MKQVKRRKKRLSPSVNPLGNYYSSFLILQTAGQTIDIERLSISSKNDYERKVTTQNMNSAESNLI